MIDPRRQFHRRHGGCRAIAAGRRLLFRDTSALALISHVFWRACLRTRSALPSDRGLAAACVAELLAVGLLGASGRLFLSFIVGTLLLLAICL